LDREQEQIRIMPSIALLQAILEDPAHHESGQDHGGSANTQQNFYAYLGLRPAARKKPATVYIAQGLSTKRVAVLAGILAIEQSELLHLIDVSGSTFNRRMKTPSQRLKPGESDRLARIAHILALAVGLMEGDEDAARQWLKTPAPALGGETPLQHLGTETGAREVERLINQIEHGVYI
jgi:putative toxin-antitoxin system antitoxin component (TIGR02293 family)